MPKLHFTETYRKHFSKLPTQIKKKAKKALRLLEKNPAHPSLRSKPVESAHGIFEASVDLKYRLTYERLPGDVLRLRVIGKHNETLRNP